MLVWSVRDFGATGDGSTDDGPAILAAQEEAVRKRGSVYFPPGGYFIAFPTSERSTVRLVAPMVFEYGARLKPALPPRPRPGAGWPDPTVIIQGPIQAHPDQEIFDVSLGESIREEEARWVMEEARWVMKVQAGLEAVLEGPPKDELRPGVLFANWWSGRDIGERWNNMMRSIQKIGAKPGSPVPTYLRIAPGRYTFQHTLRCVGLRAGQVLDFLGASLFSQCTDRVAVDLTASSGCTILHLNLVGVEGKETAIGVLESRPDVEIKPKPHLSEPEIRVGASSGKNIWLSPGMCTDPRLDAGLR